MQDENSSHPQRFVLNLDTRDAKVFDTSNRMGEMPCINYHHTAKQHRHFYYAASPCDRDNQPMQAISKVSIAPDAGLDGSISPGDVKESVRVLGPTEFCGELGLVPKPDAVDEDDCWILAYVHDAVKMKAHVLILDAKDVVGEPVARIDLPVYLPQGLHGAWSDVAHLEEAERKVRPGIVVSKSIDTHDWSPIAGQKKVGQVYCTDKVMDEFKQLVSDTLLALRYRFV